MVLVLLAREGARGPEREFSLAGFRSFLTIPVGLFLLLGLVYPLVLWSANGMVGAFLNEALGVDVGQVGFYTSLFGVGAVLGALAGGPIADRLSRRDSLIAALVLSSLALLALVFSGSPSIALGVVILFGIAFGYYETVHGGWHGPYRSAHCGNHVRHHHGRG
jgi:predicted MFS family arabinose efflux permease